MGLAQGARVGPYEVLGILGAGGMGEVFRARDTRLGREVALKMLPAAVAGDPDRLRRFDQEARAAGALNHPNVLAVLDVGEHEGTPYLVAELLEGETLRERLKGGPLPPRKALDCAGQIARGLAAAHDKGIIHRDLKPENLFVTKDGRVKILDFGLAKAVGGEVSAMESTLAETEPGAVLGTAGYMAPEQVRGKPADLRADIFALGAVLYEMLTGRRAFDGDSAIDRAHAILNKEPPPLADAGVTVSPAVQRVLDRCLEKAPDERFQSVRDLGFALEVVASPSGTSGEGAVAPASAARRVRSRPGWAGIAVAAVLALTAGALGGRWLARDTVPAPAPITATAMHRFHIDVSVSSGVWRVPTAALSPDGRTLVYVDRGELQLRPLAQLAPRALPGTSGASAPFWSPDGASIAFFDPAKLELRATSVHGGATRTICTIKRTASGATAAWGADDRIVFVTQAGVLHEVSARGGEPHPWPVPGIEPGKLTFGDPQFLPDGKRLLVIAWTRDLRSRAYLVAPDGAKPLQGLGDDVDFCSYSPSGHLLYRRKDGRLWAVSFDPARAATTGAPFPIAASGDYPMGAASGTLVYVSPPREQLAWVDREGRVLGEIGEPRQSITHPAIARDGVRVAASVTEAGQTAIWIHDGKRGTSAPVTRDAWDVQPAWLGPTDTLVFASSGRQASIRSTIPTYATFTVLHMVTPSNGGKVTSVPGLIDMETFEPAPSPTGDRIAFATMRPSAGEAEGKLDNYDVWYTSVVDGRPQPLVATPAAELLPAIAPDGKHLAYMSDGTGRMEIYVVTFPDGKRTFGPISRGGGIQPKWSGRGELFFLDAEGLMAAKVDTSRDFTWEEPRRVFTEATLGASIVDRSISPVTLRYDVAPSGDRFAVVRSITGPESGIVVVHNWLAEPEGRPAKAR